MFVLLAASLGHYFFGIVIFLTSLFLILLVLVQRGRGGGLTGALGGMGGQSAFGAKAGDTFTRVTMVTATFWILICMAAIKFLGTTNWGTAADNRPAMTAPQSGSGEDQDAGSTGGGAEEGTSSGAAGTGAGSGAGGGVGTLDGGSETPADTPPAGAGSSPGETPSSEN